MGSDLNIIENKSLGMLSKAILSLLLIEELRGVNNQIHVTDHGLILHQKILLYKKLKTLLSRI